MRYFFVIVLSLVSATFVGGAQLPTIARLQYGGGGDWYADPGSLSNWLELFGERTGVPVALRPLTLTLDSEELYTCPMLYITGHGRIAFTAEETGILRDYLLAGGFLYVDDNYGLDASFRETMAKVFPETSLRRLGSDHPIYHSYYDLPGLPKIHEHDGDPAQGFGIEKGGRLLVYYSWSSDIGDGLEDPDVHGDPPAAREAAARMAINILMYALTAP